MKLFKTFIDKIKIELELKRNLKKEANAVYSQYIFNDLELEISKEEELSKEFKKYLTFNKNKYLQKHGGLLFMYIFLSFFLFIIASLIIHKSPWIFLCYLPLLGTFYHAYKSTETHKFHKKTHSVAKNILEKKGDLYLAERKKMLVENINDLYYYDEKIDAELKNYIINDLYQYAQDKNNNNFINNLDFFGFQTNAFFNIQKEHNENVSKQKEISQKIITNDSILNDLKSDLNKKIDFIKQSKV